MYHDRNLFSTAIRGVILCLIMALVLSVFYGCSEEEDTPFLTIDTVTANPAICSPNDTVEVVVTYSYEGGGDISIDWTASDGTIIPQSNDAYIYWVAPETLDWFTIEVELSDESNNPSGYVIIDVTYDEAKQSFTDDILSIMVENQSHPEVAANGQAAFTAYANSGFTDLDSAALAAESFRTSIQNDSITLVRLDSITPTGDDAQNIIDDLVDGIIIMDEGNEIYAIHLERAPDQTIPERAAIFDSTAPALEKYIDGLTLIIASFENLEEYIETNCIDGASETAYWLNKFREEKQAIEDIIGG